LAKIWFDSAPGDLEYGIGGNDHTDLAGVIHLLFIVRIVDRLMFKVSREQEKKKRGQPLWVCAQRGTNKSR
jgi:hypothetical protein